MRVTMDGLTSIRGIGSKKAEQVIEFCKGDAEFLLATSSEDLIELGIIGYSDISNIKSWLKSAMPETDPKHEGKDMANSMGQVVKDTVRSFDDVAKENTTEEDSDIPEVPMDSDELMFSLGPDEEKVDLKEVLDRRDKVNIDDKLYIVKKTEIDSHTIYRKRIELTPAVCNICAYDICDHHNLGYYYDLDVRIRTQLKQALAQHKIVYHPVSSRDIISKNEMMSSNLGT